MVLAAGETDSSRARDALAALCETYWYPLYAFIRRQGHTAEESADLAQGYFVQLLEKGEQEERLRELESVLGPRLVKPDQARGR